MPISSFGDYTAQHWAEVKDILERAIDGASMQPRPVWHSSDTDIIQGRIVRNLYECPMVVCDISGLNPNVMFELGMRLTFRKPVIVVSDTGTRLPFDTGVIDTLMYPADLHFSSIEKFISDLSGRIMDLSAAAQSGAYKPYLDTFGAFQVVDPPSDHVSFSTHIADQLERMEAKLNRLERARISSAPGSSGLFGGRGRGALDPYTTLSNPYEEAPLNALLAVYAKDNENEDYEARSGGWTDDRVSRLIALWKEGKSASEIARELGGVSRNAVIGKAARLGLKPRPESTKD